MKKDVLENLVGLVDENLPTILKGVGCATGITTIGYSVYAGWKLRDVLEDEDTDGTTKFKKGLLTIAPVIVGTATSAALIVASDREYAKRYAALGALAVANKADVKELGNEALDKLGLSDKKKDKKKEEKKPKQQKTPYANGDFTVEIHDLVTDYVFRTTLNDFWYTVGVFNEQIPDECSGESVGIDEFYRLLLKDEYAEVPTHSCIRFGDVENSFDPEHSVTTKVFSPSLESEITDKLTLRYVIDYNYN